MNKLLNGIFLIRNTASGKYLNIWGTDQVGNGRNICQYDLLAELNQLFWVQLTNSAAVKLSSIMKDENGQFYSLNVNGSNMNTNLYREEASNDADSALIFEPVSEDRYRIKLAYSRSNGTDVYLTAIGDGNGNSATTATTGNVIWKVLDQSDGHQIWDFEFMVEYPKESFDIRKLDAQIFLHKFYGCTTPIDAKAGTVLCRELIKALQQILLNIGEGAEGYGSFGPSTEKACPTLMAGMSSNSKTKALLTLFCHAMFCKGYTTTGIYDSYNTNVENGVKKLQAAVGMKQDGVVIPALMKAVFNTDSYVLSSRGTEAVQRIQKALNGSYFDYTGINPCDGMYDRATNKALIYALQKEEGISAEEASGSFLSKTFSLCPTLPFSGTETLNEAHITKIVQYALHVNGFYETANFDGVYNDLMKQGIREFQAFMAYPIQDRADPSTIKALMASCGDTNRACVGCDASAILNAGSANALYKAGYRYVGRYLTGTVGGTRSKALSVKEAHTILDAGLKIVPIYQDGGTYASYFTKERAVIDAHAALSAAEALGLPLDTTVYFAVDCDLVDSQIENGLSEYFKVLSDVVALNTSEVLSLSVGVYGTRNVCSKMIGAGYAVSAYVSDMSTGYSGNLGFKMPAEWAFDQFYEWTAEKGSNLPIDIDKVAVSGRDPGVSQILRESSGEATPTEAQLRAAFQHKFCDFQEDVPVLQVINPAEIELNVPVVVINHKNVKIEVEISDTAHTTSENEKTAMIISWDGAQSPSLNISSAIEQSKKDSLGYGMWEGETLPEGSAAEQLSVSAVSSMFESMGYSIKSGKMSLTVEANPIKRTVTFSTVAEITDLPITPNYSSRFTLTLRYIVRLDPDAFPDAEGEPIKGLSWETAAALFGAEVELILSPLAKGLTVAFSSAGSGVGHKTSTTVVVISVLSLLLIVISSLFAVI